MTNMYFRICLTFIFCLSVSSFINGHPDSPQEITVSIYSPGQNQIVDTLLNIAVTIQSVYALQSIKASVADRETDLVYSNGMLRGTLNLNGLNRGVKTLNIKAVDIQNYEVNVTREFVYNRKPVLEVLKPIQNDITTTNLNINVNFWDDGISGNRIYVYMDDDLLLLKTASFDTTVDLSFSTEGNHIIRITGIDSLDQYVDVKRNFQFYNSPLLNLEYFMEYPVWDMDSSRILSSSGQEVRINNYKTGTVTNITLPRDLFIVTGAYLIKDGFLGVLEPESAYLNDSVFEWKNGAITNLGPISSSYSLVVKGEWAIWNSGPNLKLRNNITGLVTNIAGNTVNIENDLSDSGVVAYGTYGDEYSIFKYYNGEYTKMSTSGMNTYPLTDGRNFLYRRSGDTLILNDGNSESVLSFVPGLGPKIHYDVNNGWIAYCKEGEIGQLNVWLRNPAGEDKKLTPFGTSSYWPELNQDGQCIFQNMGFKYLADFSGRFKKITSLPGTPVWLGDGFYYRNINAIYKVDTTISSIAEPSPIANGMGFQLLQNYPNPFNPVTNIKYSLTGADFVNLKVFDLLGREIASPVNSEQKPGNYNILFDGIDYSSGIYIARLSVGNKSASIKMILLK